MQSIKKKPLFELPEASFPKTQFECLADHPVCCARSLREKDERRIRKNRKVFLSPSTAPHLRASTISLLKHAKKNREVIVYIQFSDESWSDLFKSVSPPCCVRPHPHQFLHIYWLRCLSSAQYRVSQSEIADRSCVSVKASNLSRIITKNIITQQRERERES